MKTSLVIIVISAFLCAASVASEPSFFEAPGIYPLSDQLSLKITKSESLQNIDYIINYLGGGGNGGIVETHGTPFLFYWDSESQTLWWGTSAKVGYLDISTPHSGRSNSHDRGTPFHSYDKFPERPVIFEARLEKSLPLASKAEQGAAANP